MREGVAVTALSVPEEDLPEINGELGNKRVNDKWPLSYAVINSTLIICRTIIGASPTLAGCIAQMYVHTTVLAAIYRTF